MAAESFAEGSIVSAVLQGVVTRWFSDRGFGFIKPADGRDEIFAHVSEVDPDLDSLTPGQRVVFQIAQDSRRPGTVMAVKINLVDF